MDNKNADIPVKVASPTTIENKDIEQEKQATEAPVKKSTKEEKSRKKDDKSVEQVLKALNSLETTEEKLAAMCKKYSDIVDENRKLQLTVKQTEKRLSMVQREKEQLQTEHSKTVLTRSRLESLCRELQRQNKAIKDESLLKIREEEEKRKEVSAKFQSTLNEITTLMQQNNEKNSKLREDNLEMTKKFKTVCEQYELREQQVEKITKQMQLEAQLADAKLAKAKMEMAAEKEILLKEKQHLLMELTEYQAKYQELQTTEVNLRGQISLYTDKYDEFQNALSRSNEVFGGFKGEMEKMSKKICKLEKETSSWKQRWEKSHQALLEMAADKQQRDGELALATRQLAQLQKLCRTLQAERTSLLAQLRTEGASKDAVSSGKIDLPVKPLQLVQDNVSAPVNTELCRHECLKESSCGANALHEDVITLQTQNVSCQSIEKIPISSQNDVCQKVDNIPNTSIQNVNETPPDLSKDISGEVTLGVVNPEVIENSNALSVKDDLPSSTLVESTEKNVQEVSPMTTPSPTETSDLLIPVESTEKTNVQEVSLLTTPSPTETSEVSFQNQQNVILPVTQLTATDTGPHLQNETQSLTDDIKTDAKSVLSPLNENVSINDPKSESQDTSPLSLVNGQLDTREMKDNLNEEVRYVAAVDGIQVAENTVIEQIPVKTSPVDIKKGKEGGKKRRNK